MYRNMLQRFTVLTKMSLFKSSVYFDKNRFPPASGHTTLNMKIAEPKKHRRT